MPEQKPTPAGHAPAGDAARVAYYYLSQLLGVRVCQEGEKRPLGRLYDLGGSRLAPYPQAVAIDVKSRGGGHRFLPWSAVTFLSAREIRVARTDTPAPTPEFWGRRDVLDDQVVDVSGARVLRVNDVHLIHSNNVLVFAHVEVGTLGILRRLWLERPVTFLLRWLFDYTVKELFVTWRHLEVLAPGGVPGGVRLSGAPERFSAIHPAELADIMEELGVRDRKAFFDALTPESAAEALEEVTPELQRTLISQEEPGRVADILEEMPSMEAADVLRDLYQPDAQTIINNLDAATAADVKMHLAHGNECAGGIMATACLEAVPGETAGTVLARIRHRAEDAEIFAYVYVLDPERRLLGVVTLRPLLQAPVATTMAELMTADPVTVTPETDLRDVGKLFAKYAFQAIPVVAPEQRFVGAVRLKSIVTERAQLLKDA